jgi:hypothetical protein
MVRTLSHVSIYQSREPTDAHSSRFQTRTVQLLFFRYARCSRSSLFLSDSFMPVCLHDHDVGCLREVCHVSTHSCTFFTISRGIERTCIQEIGDRVPLKSDVLGVYDGVYACLCVCVCVCVCVCSRALYMRTFQTHECTYASICFSIRTHPWTTHTNQTKIRRRIKPRQRPPTTPHPHQLHTTLHPHPLRPRTAPHPSRQVAQPAR